ncbi:MAG: helix-turn-helix transcriptional regulator [Tatlockia sp.]|nr:helix-turn-helix transcriptional regulator [Tatlockia sp.]
MLKPTIIIHPLLLSYVKSIQLEDSEQSTHSYRIYPGLTLVMGFQTQGAIAHVAEDNKKTPLKPSGITGLLTQYRNFQSSSPLTKSILIEFYPWAINYLFKESAKAFSNQSLGLSDLINEQVINQLEEKIHGTTDLQTQITLIQNFLVSLVSRDVKPHARIIRIVKHIMTNPTQSVQELAKNQGYSQRTLERHFNELIGISPKQLMRISRFQKVLEQIHKGYPWTLLAEHFNYYDQSHFIKEFRQYTGKTPDSFF